MLPILLAISILVQTSADDYLYEVTLLRAAPGQLLALIDQLQERMTVYDDAGDQRPAILRHSQGDHWDLMLVQPIGTLAEFHAPPRVQRRLVAENRSGLTNIEFNERLQRFTSWREETIFAGPPLAEVGPRLRDAGFFHIEMFIALPGRRAELLREREMENEYLRLVGRPENALFAKRSGGSWDAVTIGFYRDIKHFAESADIPADRAQTAALAAGFEGADRIGTYLRSLISSHHDTLATPVR